MPISRCWLTGFYRSNDPRGVVIDQIAVRDRRDTRVAVRKFFEVERHHIVLAALQSLAEGRSVPREVLARAIER